MPHVLLTDMAVHHFDLARLFGAGKPLSVLGTDWNPKGSWFNDGASAMAVFRMEGNMVLTYRGTWVATGCGAWNLSWRFAGTKGTLLWDSGDRVHAEILDPPEQPAELDGNKLVRTFRTIAIPEIQKIDMREGHDGAIYDFVMAIKGERPQLLSPCHDNIWSALMGLGAIESAQNNTLYRFETLHGET